MEERKNFEVHNLTQEELGELLADLGTRGIMRPTLHQRIDELAGRIREKTDLPDEVWSEVLMRRGMVIRWGFSVGTWQEKGTVQVAVRCNYEDRSDNYEVSISVYSMGGMLHMEREHVGYPNPEDYEEKALNAVKLGTGRLAP